MNFLISDSSTAAYKIVFEGLSNSLVCAAVAVAGIAIEKYPKLSVLGPDFAPLISFFVLLLAVLLFMWNTFLTFYSLRINALTRRTLSWLIDLPLFAIYVTISLSILGAAAKLQGSQLKPVTSPELSTHRAC